MHPALLRQLDEYRAHVTRLRQYLALVSLQGISHLDGQAQTPRLSGHASPNRTDDLALLDKEGMPTLFFLTAEGGQLTPTFPAELQSLLGDTWQLRLGLFATSCAQSCCILRFPGTPSTLLGHGERGEAPWGSLSSLLPIPWRRRLGFAFVQIITDAGFEVQGEPALEEYWAPMTEAVGASSVGWPVWASAATPKDIQKRKPLFDFFCHWMAKNVPSLWSGQSEPDTPKRSSRISFPIWN